MKMPGKRIGYVRVSSTDQNPERQLEGIQLDKKFIEYASGASIKRPELERMLEYAREDDTIIVHSLDRFARNTNDLLNLVDNLLQRNICIQFIKENLNFDGTKNPMSRLILVVIGAIAEFERELIRERQREGIALAKKAGVYFGRPTSLTKEIKEAIKEALQTRKTKSKIAEELGISRFSLYRYIKEIGIET